MLQLYVTKIYLSAKYILSVVTSHIIFIADCNDNIFLKTPQGLEAEERNWKLEFQNIFSSEREECHMNRVGSKYHLNIWQMHRYLIPRSVCDAWKENRKCLNVKTCSSWRKGLPVLKLQEKVISFFKKKNNLMFILVMFELLSDILHWDYVCHSAIPWKIGVSEQFPVLVWSPPPTSPTRATL